MATTITQDEIQGTTLGYTAITANITTTSTTYVQATGLSSTVAVPSGGRKVKVSFYCGAVSNSTLGTVWVSLWDGTVGTGTQVGEAIGVIAGAGYVLPFTCISVLTPASGSKTYNVGWKINNPTGQMAASTVAPAFILVELI